MTNVSGTSDRPRIVPRIHIVGRKNAGKTTLVCDLIKELSGRGLRVATVKHTHHHHELDTPGKDSHRHRESGAAGVGILSPGMTAAFIPRNATTANDHYFEFNTLFHDCDLILVEGDLNTSAMRVEVWRSVLEDGPYAATMESISAVVSDDRPQVTCAVWKRSPVDSLATEIWDLVQSSLNAGTVD